MNILKWIGIAIGIFVIFGMLFPEIYGPSRSYATSRSDGDPSPPAVMKLDVVNHFEDISKDFYHCEAIAIVNDTASLDALANQLVYIAKEKACGVLHVYKSQSGIRYQESEAYAREHPEAAADYIGKVGRDKRVEWGVAYLEYRNQFSN